MRDEDKPTRKGIYFLCYMTEKMSRMHNLPKSDIVNKMDREFILNRCEHEHINHCLNLDEFALEELKTLGVEHKGTFLREERARFIAPGISHMTKVYSDIIMDMGGDLADNFKTVMLSPIANLIDDYNSNLYLLGTEFLIDCIRAGHVVDEFE